MIGRIFILPLLGLQEKLNFKNFPIEELPQTLLFKCGLKETKLCTFCTETKESLLHLFWECISSKNFWFSLVNVFKNVGLNTQYPLDPQKSKSF